MAKTTKKKDPTLTGYTAEKPSFISKCIHTFKCMFNPGGKDCEKTWKRRTRCNDQITTRTSWS